MSRLADLTTEDDYPKAAGKHLDDAEVLARERRWDGAAYHVGYVVECCLKSVVLVAAGLAPHTHDLRWLSAEAVRLAALPGARTARYATGGALPASHSLYDLRGGWGPELRYRAPGAVSEHQARAWLVEARRVYEATIARMRLDGVV